MSEFKAKVSDVNLEARKQISEYLQNNSLSPSRVAHVSIKDGELLVKDSALVTETIRRINERESTNDTRAPIPSDVVVVCQARKADFTKTGKIPLKEELVPPSPVRYLDYVTLRGLFSLSSWKTKWNATKIGAKKLYYMATFRWP